MTDPQKLDEIISLLNFLQVHVQNNVEQSFTDLTFSLETVVRDFLNVFEEKNSQYKNANYIKNNFPAIDLINADETIAVQVTTNASKRKVEKTLATAKKHNLKFSKLIIIGFVNSTKSIVPGVEIHDIKYLIELVKFGTAEQKDSVYDILKRQIPLNILNPLGDKHCVDVVLDVIDRSAVRDYTICEGDYEKMVEGLSEIKEIITTGKVSKKSIRAKALSEYTSSVKAQLGEVEFLVSKIIQVCNANKNKRRSDFLCLSRQETDIIDDLKEQIISMSNSLAQSVGLVKRITGSMR